MGEDDWHVEDINIQMIPNPYKHPDTENINEDSLDAEEMRYYRTLELKVPALDINSESDCIDDARLEVKKQKLCNKNITQTKRRSIIKVSFQEHNLH